MSSETLTPNQSILGYTLQKHIGAGGYGEVWTAEAPGGLLKAIKFIYGFHDEARAQRELKSLNHIKQLRHPFLLSLERIDIVDGRLVIVTELADKCLSDRYDQCVEEGLVGIPRKELMGYIKEVADALDYIGKAHSLQHLDIKPENILLLSGHVKVADFGLVKDIQDCTQSVMGGLTPAYAAPELFDGRPTKLSDQYSLAIVYQEMLTGERPFTGTTPAQLAAQHIHGRPNLRPLPRADQAAVARALSKNPEYRYGSCGAFIDEIINGERTETSTATRTKHRTRKTRRAKDSDHEQTVVLGDLPTSRCSENVTKLPPVEFLPDDARIHPTLFVGVGGMGTRILRDLKERFHDRLASTETLPAFRFLAVDVDQDDLFAASRGRSTRGLADVEIFEMPLRRPDQYRNDKSLDLTWISRRWIYNVPRSRKTEGIRPVGRLAFVDNSERFHEQLAKTIAPFRDETNLRSSAEKIGIAADPKPRVYIVGAVSGGVGSGTILDVAYSIRNAFIENGHDKIDIIGILSHGTGRTSSLRSISAANTYAFLRELQHIRKNGYPGDEACGLPPFEPDEPPFDSTYLIHMGEDQTDELFRARTETMAEYIFLDCATVCNAANAAARGDAEGEDRLRTFGVSKIDVAAEASSDKLQQLLADHLIKRWVGENTSVIDNKAAIRKLRANLQLSPSNIFDIVTSVVVEITGLNPFDLAGEVARNVGRVELNEDNFTLVPEEIESSIRGWFHTENSGVNGHTVIDRANRSLARLAKENIKKLESLIATLVDDQGFLVSNATNMVHEFERTVRQFSEATMQSYEENAAELRASEEAWSSIEVLENESLPADINRFAHVMARDELAKLALKFVECLLAETQTVGHKVQHLTTTLHRVAALLPKATPSVHEDYDDGFAYHFQNYLIGEVASHVPRLVQRLDEYLQQTFFERSGGFWAVLSAEDNRELHELADAISSAARKFVQSEIAQIDIDDVIGARRIGEDELVDWVRPSVEDATPHILDCGGEARLMVNVPQMSSGETCSQALEVVFDESPTIVRSTQGNVTLCFEVQQIPVANIALRLIEDAPEAGDCVGRLISRTDLEWVPLTGIA